MGCPRAAACIFHEVVEPSIVKRVKYAAAYPYCRGGRHGECALYARLERREPIPRNLMPDGSYGDYLEPGKEQQRARAAGSTRFLVVDDSPVFATIAANTLRMRYPGAEVVQCHSFEEAEAALKRGDVTLIVSGHGLGGGKSFRDLRRLSGAPMVLFTGWPPAPHEVPAGCWVVTKDSGPEALRAAIEGVLSG